MSLTEQYCAGEHLLSTITPTVYQSGTAHQLKQMTFGYSGPVQDSYYDSGNNNQNGTAYNAQTYWQYLTSYLDTNTGVGATTITYSTAYNNTHGTPSVKRTAAAASPMTATMPSSARCTPTMAIAAAAAPPTPTRMSMPGASRS